MVLSIISVDITDGPQIHVIQTQYINWLLKSNQYNNNNNKKIFRF